LPNLPVLTDKKSVAENLSPFYKIPCQLQSAKCTQTDAQGRFTLTSFDPNDGAVPGKYYVGIAKVVLEDAAAGQGGPGGEQDPEAKIARDMLPVKYKVPQQSGLTADISASGPNELKFELTD